MKLFLYWALLVGALPPASHLSDYYAPDTASGSTTLTSSTSRLPCRSSEILMLSGLTLVYFEITSINSLCKAGRKSGPDNPLRSRAMKISNHSFAALAVLGLLLKRKDNSAITYTRKNTETSPVFRRR